MFKTQVEHEPQASDFITKFWTFYGVNFWSSSECRPWTNVVDLFYTLTMKFSRWIRSKARAGVSSYNRSFFTWTRHLWGECSSPMFCGHFTTSPICFITKRGKFRKFFEICLMLRLYKVMLHPSLVPRRSLLLRCPREDWERASVGDVTAQSRIQVWPSQNS